MNNKRFWIFAVMSVLFLVYGFYIEKMIFPQPGMIKDLVMAVVVILFLISTVLTHKGVKRANDLDIRYLILLSVEGFFLLILVVTNKLPY